MASVHTQITCEAQLSALLSDTVEGVGISGVVNLNPSLTLTQGIGANQVSAVAVDRDRALSGAVNVDYDLITLSGFAVSTDPLRNAITPANVVAFMVVNKSTSTNSIRVGGAASNPWSDPFTDSDDGGDGTRITIPPGGFIFLAAPTATGYPLSGSSKVLRVGSAAGTNVFDIVVFARTA